jgi:flagellar hook-basal body complex protein FliE
MSDPVATLVIRPQANALSAYQRTASGDEASGDLGSFGSVMQRAMQGVVDTQQDAETKSMQGIAGQANLTDVVTAVSKAELALQTTVAIRDRMVSAYQTIMNMSI